MNRLLVPPELLYDSQSRADLLAAAAISGFVLNSLSALEVTSRAADPVVLDGTRGRGVSPLLLPGGALARAQPAVAWAAEALLQHTPADTVSGRPGRLPNLHPPPHPSAVAALTLTRTTHSRTPYAKPL